MKPTSIISLIVAVVLVIVGLATCIIGQNMANAGGEALFAEETGEGLIKTVNLDDVDISRIDLSCANAAVNVYGNSEVSYVEFINFRENYYTLSTANKTLTFREITDLVSMLKFWENGFSFKGLRHIFNFSADEGSAREINIHLTADHPIKIFNIASDEGSVRLDSMTSASDYNLTVGAGDVTVNGLSTTSAFKLNGDTVTLSMKNTAVNSAEIKAETSLQMNADGFRAANQATVETKEGSVSITSSVNLTSLNLHLDTISGKVLLNGVDRGTHYESEPNPDAEGSVTIKTESADIAFKQNLMGGTTAE